MKASGNHRYRIPTVFDVPAPHEEPKSPKVARFKTTDEYDFIKHQDVLIEFPPGGSIGDHYWNIQYLHNSSVLAEYYFKKTQIAPIKLHTYVMVPDYSFIIQLYSKSCNGLMCEYNIQSLIMHYSLSPPITPQIDLSIIPDDHELWFIDTFDLDINELICVCDGVEVPLRETNGALAIPSTQ